MTVDNQKFATHYSSLICQAMLMSFRKTNDIHNDMHLSLHEKLGISLETGVNGTPTLRMPVAGNQQISGALHGGATALLMESCAGIAATQWLESQNSKAGDKSQKSVAVGIDVSITHLRPATSGWVVAEAEPVHLGRTRLIYCVEVRREADGKLVSIGTIAHAVLPKNPV